MVAVHPRRNGLVADRQDALGLQLHVDRLQDGGLQIGVGVLAQLVLGGGRRGVLAHGSFQGRARFGLRLHLGLLCNGREALQAGGELGLVDLVVGGVLLLFVDMPTDPYDELVQERACALPLRVIQLAVAIIVKDCDELLDAFLIPLGAQQCLELSNRDRAILVAVHDDIESIRFPGCACGAAHWT